jgi:hypothetical protein
LSKSTRKFKKLSTPTNTTSRFLKATLESGLTRDPIGVATDLEIAFMLFTHRLDAVLLESQISLPDTV